MGAIVFAPPSLLFHLPLDSGLHSRLYDFVMGTNHEAESATMQIGWHEVAERATPVAAVVAALSTLACCLPLGFLARLDWRG